MTTLAPRVYVTNDTDALVRAIAITSGSSYVSRSDLCVSLDGTTFNTVLFNSRQSGPGYFNGSIVQPALDIDGQDIDFSDGTFTYDGKTYVLDETATIGEIITKPIMRVVEIVQTHAGYYVAAQNKLDGRSHDYLNGQPLVITGGIRARGSEDDLVAHAQYVGHDYIVRGDHLDMTQQTATFDGQPATQLKVEDYTVTFTDDLSTATVTKK